MDIHIRQKLFEALVKFKLIRKSQPSVFRAFLEGKLFEKDLLEPLLEIELLTQMKEIKAINQFLKEVRSADYVSYHEKVISEEFFKKVIEPLEKLVGWKKPEEKMPNELAKELNNKTEGRTIKEKREKMSGFMKTAIIGGTIATLLGVGIGAGYSLFRPKENPKNKGKAEK
ncbi:MAG: hypothetical protein AAB596_01200 [Patescibacteria group bacterium]